MIWRQFLKTLLTIFFFFRDVEGICTAGENVKVLSKFVFVAEFSYGNVAVMVASWLKIFTFL